MQKMGVSFGEGDGLEKREKLRIKGVLFFVCASHFGNAKILYFARNKTVAILHCVKTASAVYATICENFFVGNKFDVSVCAVIKLKLDKIILHTNANK